MAIGQITGFEIRGLPFSGSRNTLGVLGGIRKISRWQVKVPGVVSNLNYSLSWLSKRVYINTDLFNQPRERITYSPMSHSSSAWSV